MKLFIKHYVVGTKTHSTKPSQPQRVSSVYCVEIEPRHEKTGFLHMRKQRRRSASR